MIYERTVSRHLDIEILQPESSSVSEYAYKISDTVR